MTITVSNEKDETREMILSIDKNSNSNYYYFINVRTVNWSSHSMYIPQDVSFYCNVASALKIPVRDYCDILIQNRAFLGSNGLYVFQYKEEAEKALNELEAYLILNKLIE